MTNPLTVDEQIAALLRRFHNQCRDVETVADLNVQIDQFIQMARHGDLLRADSDYEWMALLRRRTSLIADELANLNAELESMRGS